MFSFDSQDILQSFERATNINSAIKNFLKKQVRPGDGVGRFVKDLKDVLLSKRPELALTFIERHAEEFTPHLLAIGAYAHAGVVDKIADVVVTKYADDFNKSYSSSGEEVKITDQKKFSSIMKSAAEEVDSGLESEGLGKSPFLRAIVLNAIFEQPVLKAGLDEGIL